MITQEYLKSILSYDKDSGLFTWKINIAISIRVGDIAGTIMNTGYRRIRINKKGYYAHRLAWLYMTGNFPKEIDHINRIKDDNQFCNLRLATHQSNMQNRNIQENNKSGVTGVCWHKKRNKWCVNIKVNKIQKHIGYFANFNDAVKARKKAETEYGFYRNFT